MAVAKHEGEPFSPEVLALQIENAELRADVMALWQRLGDVIAMHNPKDHRSEKDQIVLSHARQLHSRWTVKR